MKLNYDKSEWDRIPEEIRQLDTKELDFSKTNPDRELHKLEMDRRLYISGKFFPQFTWEGEPREHRFTDKDVPWKTYEDDWIDEDIMWKPPGSNSTEQDTEEKKETTQDGAVSASLEKFIEQ